MNYLENSFFIFENKINMFPSIDSTTTEFRIAEVDVSMCYVYSVHIGKISLGKKKDEDEKRILFSSFRHLHSSNSFLPYITHKIPYILIFLYVSPLQHHFAFHFWCDIFFNSAEVCPLSPCPIFSDSVKIISWRIVSTDFHQFLLFTNFFYSL